MRWAGRQVAVYAHRTPADMRKGFDSLCALVSEQLMRNPLNGDVYLFVSRDRIRTKVLHFDGTGLCLYVNQPSSHYTSSNSIRARRVCRGRWDSGRSVDEPIPSTALLDRRIRPRILVEPRVAVGRMRPNNAVLSPSDDGVFVNGETLRHLRLREHASIPKSIVPGAEPVSMHEIRHAEGGKARVVPTWSSRSRT